MDVHGMKRLVIMPLNPVISNASNTPVKTDVLGINTFARMQLVTVI